MSDLLVVNVTSKLNPRTWENVGEQYTVREYKYMATYGCTINKCFCYECVAYRKGKELHKMYEVVEPENKRGSLLFQECCEILGN